MAAHSVGWMAHYLVVPKAVSWVAKSVEKLVVMKADYWVARLVQNSVDRWAERLVAMMAALTVR